MTAAALIAAQRPHWVERLDELHLLTPLRILIILLVAVVATLLLRTVVRRILRRTLELGADRGRAEARQRALATALRSALVGVLWTAAAITIVSEVGINIGAFVATATVVGGAVAFGAQTLIRDVISGFFVLAEDQYGVGDQVDLGLASGVVDRITLRTVRLRDGEGRVWHVPHGGVVRVANLSKVGLALLDVEVARTSSLSDVTAATATMIEALQSDDAVRSLLTGEPSVVGIVDVSDDRLVYRVTVPTVPGRPDAVRRAWLGIVLGAFADGRLVAPTAAPLSVITAPAEAPSSEPAE